MIGMEPALCEQVNLSNAREVFATQPAYASQLSGPGLMLLQRTNCWIRAHSRVRRLKISAFSGQLRQLFELDSIRAHVRTWGVIYSGRPRRLQYAVLSPRPCLIDVWLIMRPPQEMAATVQRVFVFCSEVLPLQFGRTVKGVLGGYSGGTREYYRGTAGYYWSTSTVAAVRKNSHRSTSANWKGSTSYCGQRYGIAIRLLGVALLSNAPVSTRIQMFRVHLVAPESGLVIPCQETCTTRTRGCSDSTKSKWLTTRRRRHGHNLLC